MVAQSISFIGHGTERGISGFPAMHLQEFAESTVLKLESKICSGSPLTSREKSEASKLHNWWVKGVVDPWKLIH